MIPKFQDFEVQKFSNVPALSREEVKALPTYPGVAAPGGVVVQKLPTQTGVQATSPIVAPKNPPPMTTVVTPASVTTTPLDKVTGFFTSSAGLIVIALAVIYFAFYRK